MASLISLSLNKVNKYTFHVPITYNIQIQYVLEYVNTEHTNIDVGCASDL